MVAKVRMCVAWGCAEALPPRSRADRLYCSPQCQRRVTVQRQRARERREAGEPPTRTDRVLEALGLADGDSPPSQRKNRDLPSADDQRRVAKHASDPSVALDLSSSFAVGGYEFQRFANSPYPALLRDKEVSQQEVADTLGVTQPHVSAWMSLYEAALRHNATMEQWAADFEQQDIRTYALASFRNFTEVFFPDDLIPDFHEEWDDELTLALDNGDRTMLLAPQRHGKTSFAVRQCLYRIAKNPNIRIIVVGKTADLARKLVGVIRQYLEHDVRFAEILLPPDTSFRPPPRRGLPWTNEELTVATRTQVMKSPTMVAIGVGGSILGRDADLILIDDPIDRKSALSPTERTNIKEWFLTDFNSRIEAHTGVIYIGSRQHKEDLPSVILGLNMRSMQEGREPDWKVLVYRAHDMKCSLPLREHPDEPDDPRNSCILWPEVRSARWLAEQQRNNPEHFQRNYMNSPSSQAFQPVSAEDVEWSYVYDEWLATHPRSPFSEGNEFPRTYGDIHRGMRLMASVDPAVAKPNAAVLWCYSTIAVSVPSDPTDPTSPLVQVYPRCIVAYAEPRPGSPGVVDILKEWYETYRVVDWVFELNYFADQISNDTSINDFKSRVGLRFHTHYTSRHNKHDDRAGLLAMLASFTARPSGIMLPGGSTSSMEAMAKFTSQMLNYDPEVAEHAGRGRKRGMSDDLLMAAWFGWYWLEQQKKSSPSHIEFQYGSGFNDFKPSYWRTAPWKDVG